MTKADVINEISLTTGIAKTDVAVVVESFMTTVKQSLLERGEPVYLRGFGSFIIKRRKEKLARNISQNTSLVVAAHDIPCFKPSKSFAEPMK